MIFLFFPQFQAQIFLFFHGSLKAATDPKIQPGACQSGQVPASRNVTFSLLRPSLWREKQQTTYYLVKLSRPSRKIETTIS